jgi:hypothetical protein
MYLPVYLSNIFFNSWSNIFDDKESGIDYYLWSVGSMPGYSDMMGFTKVSDVCVTNSPGTLRMIEGHAYYINVRVSRVDVFNFQITVIC